MTWKDRIVVILLSWHGKTGLWTACCHDMERHKRVADSLLWWHGKTELWIACCHGMEGCQLKNWYMLLVSARWEEAFSPMQVSKALDDGDDGDHRDRLFLITIGFVELTRPFMGLLFWVIMVEDCRWSRGTYSPHTGVKQMTYNLYPQNVIVFHRLREWHLCLSDLHYTGITTMEQTSIENFARWWAVGKQACCLWCIWINTLLSLL